MAKTKFSIAKVVDLDKLDHKIDQYVAKTGERDPYLFMSADTVEAIASAFGVVPNHASGYRSKYEGYKIFTDDELGFGEVEIR